ncbi:MAG: Serine/threonine-protein phosphatase 2A activator 2 [Cirrosporium novae-zelandiae]|nr:MAG: Serine/threonine-protein phosphatase 2A activator 2 [Cirrosporium novae-zelandiae]
MEPSSTKSSPSSSIPPLLSAKIPKLTPRHRKASPPADLIPVPTSTPLPAPPPLSASFYDEPVRRILNPQDHQIYLQSSTYKLLLSWIFALTDSVIDTPISAVPPPTESTNPTLTHVLDLLHKANDLINECPPVKNSSRFGNVAFRTYLDALTDLSPALHEPIFPKGGPHPTGPATAAVAPYFLSSLGSALRLDFGSGHELAFLAYLLCLYLLGLIPKKDFPTLVLRVYPAYLTLIRNLQATYYLEPAGSHGVWGLDDYVFMPFLFGSSQLLHHRYITPKGIHSALTLAEEGPNYFYLDQIAHINASKSVQGLRWHSPMLDDISGSKSWEKVENGMKRLFVKEVLGKRAVMQHFLFGGLLPGEDGMSEGISGEEGSNEVEEEEEGEGGDDHHHHQHKGHNHTGLGDCCGIKVPSSVAALQEHRKKMGGHEGLRIIPFD